MHLKLTIGPMFSGKSTRGIATANHHAGLGSRVLWITSTIDTRTMSSTHGTSLLSPAVVQKKVNTIAELDLTDVEVLIVDEAQFIPDLINLLAHESRLEYVHVCGLSSDYRHQMFPSIASLIPYADSLKKVSARCECYGKAVLSCRTIDSNENIVIGAGESYRASCRDCVAPAPL